MKFFTTITLATLIAVAAALPQNDSPQDNIEDDSVKVPAAPQGLEDGAPVTVEGADTDKRDPELLKRNFNIQVWGDPKKQGRHQSLSTHTQKCYNLGNHWDNSISSLSVPKGHGCLFYDKRHCPQHGARLTVPGGNYVRNLKHFGFNDKISSYICYNN